MPGLSIEGWRLRRRQGVARGRALRVAVTGPGTLAVEVARRVASLRIAETILSSETSAGADATGSLAGAAVKHAVRLDGAAPSDVLIVASGRADDSSTLAARVRDAALWAARTCPDTVVIIAAPGGLALSREAARASGLTPYLILSPGAMPRAAREAAAVARRLDLGASQIQVPVIGGDMADGDRGTRVLWRYAAVAGIPMGALRGWREPAADGVAGPGAADGEIAAAAAALARAVVEDRRQILCCGAWVEGPFGIPGAFVSAPVRVGARGAEEPIELRLTMEERSLLIDLAGR